MGQEIEIKEEEVKDSSFLLLLFLCVVKKKALGERVENVREEAM